MQHRYTKTLTGVRTMMVAAQELSRGMAPAVWVPFSPSFGAYAGFRLVVSCVEGAQKTIVHIFLSTGCYFGGAEP
jgi:tellurite resistance protein TehA-like permease